MELLAAAMRVLYGKKFLWALPCLVDHERMRFHGAGRVVERVRVLRGFALQRALVVQRPRPAITEKPAAKVKWKLFIRLKTTMHWFANM